jgi:sugar lactone lactonase YvrE
MCPQCNVKVKVPANGAEGFMVASHQAAQLKIYSEMVATEKAKSIRKRATTGGSSTRVVDVPTSTATPHTLTGGPSTRVVDVPTSTATPHTLTGGPSTRVVDVPTSIVTSNKLKVRKFHKFDIYFIPSGITCTPAGNVVVCEWNRQRVRMYTQAGKQVMDLQTPVNTRAWDLDCNDANIFVTDRETESVLVFDHEGCLVSTEKIHNVKDISGISVSNGTVYISEANSNNVIEMDLSEDNKLSNQRQFAAGLQLNRPLYVSARGDVVAISSWGNHRVYCLDSRGGKKYTYREPGRSRRFHSKLQNPRGVVLDRNNTLFIADSDNHRVLVVSDEGRLTGHLDLTQHELLYPYCLTLDTKGKLLVACMKDDASGYCIAKF